MPMPFISTYGYKTVVGFQLEHRTPSHVLPFESRMVRMSPSTRKCITSPSLAFMTFLAPSAPMMWPDLQAYRYLPAAFCVLEPVSTLTESTATPMHGPHVPSPMVLIEMLQRQRPLSGSADEPSTPRHRPWPVRVTLHFLASSAMSMAMRPLHVKSRRL